MSSSNNTTEAYMPYGYNGYNTQPTGNANPYSPEYAEAYNRSVMGKHEEPPFYPYYAPEQVASNGRYGLTDAWARGSSRGSGNGMDEEEAQVARSQPPDTSRYEPSAPEAVQRAEQPQTPGEGSLPTDQVQTPTNEPKQTPPNEPAQPPPSEPAQQPSNEPIQPPPTHQITPQSAIPAQPQQVNQTAAHPISNPPPHPQDAPQPQHHHHHHRKRPHVITGKQFGKDMLIGVHLAEKAAASGALGPQAKALAIAAETAETAIRGIAKGESAKQIAKESAATAISAAVGGGMKGKLVDAVASKALGIHIDANSNPADAETNRLQAKAHHMMPPTPQMPAMPAAPAIQAP